MSILNQIKALKTFNTKFTCPLNGIHLNYIISKIEENTGEEELPRIKALLTFNSDKGIFLSGYNIKDLVSRIEEIGTNDTNLLTKLRYIKNEYWYNTKFNQPLNGIQVRYLLDCVEDLYVAPVVLTQYYLHEIVSPLIDSFSQGITTLTIDGNAIDIATDYNLGLPLAIDPYLYPQNFAGYGFNQALADNGYFDLVPAEDPYCVMTGSDLYGGSPGLYLLFVSNRSYTMSITDTINGVVNFEQRVLTELPTYEVTITTPDANTENVLSFTFTASNGPGTTQVLEVNSTTYFDNFVDTHKIVEYDENSGWVYAMMQAVGVNLGNIFGTTVVTSSYVDNGDGTVTVQIINCPIRLRSITTDGGTFNFTEI